MFQESRKNKILVPLLLIEHEVLGSGQGYNVRDGRLPGNAPHGTPDLLSFGLAPLPALREHGEELQELDRHAHPCEGER